MVNPRPHTRCHGQVEGKPQTDGRLKKTPGSYTFQLLRLTMLTLLYLNYIISSLINMTKIQM